MLTQYVISIPLGFLFGGILFALVPEGVQRGPMAMGCLFLGWLLGLVTANRLYWRHQRKKAALYRDGGREL